MRRSSAVTLVLLGAAGIGAAAYGLDHAQRSPVSQADRCGDEQRDASSCDRQHGGSYAGHGGSGAVAASGGRRGEDAAAPRSGAGPDEAARGVVRGGFGEAGAAHGAGGGE